MADYIVIFGAAVRPDGSPSGSLQRRCDNAVHAGRAMAGTPWYLATGGVGRHGPAEALVMRDILLRQGIAPQRILLETEARDTLQSVRLCTRLLRGRGDAGRVYVSSSSYHGPRCSLLFRLAGFSSEALPVASDRPFLGWAKWLRYVAKELLATPWDAAWLLAHRIGRTI
ncbi:MAG: YdcF family protein [Aquabacterium sp.]